MGNSDIAMFNGVGFHTWQVKLKGHLMKKGLWSIITTEGENLTVAQQCERQMKDEKALGILLTSVADDIVHHLDQATTAKTAWETLERTFGAKSKHSKISLKMQLYGLTMHENESLSSLVNRLKSICTQLSYIECNIDKDDKIAVLLKSLPMQFENIVTVLKEKEPIPSLESIIHSLQEEDNKHTHNEVTSSTSSQALYVSTSRFKPCKHCGKTNHTSLNCFKIKKCVKCGKMGHPPQFFPKSDNGGGGNNGGNMGGKGTTSNKGRHLHYVHSEEEDNDRNGNDDNDNNDELHFISSAISSPPHASTSSSTSHSSNKKHAKGSPKKGKKSFYSDSSDDIL